MSTEFKYTREWTDAEAFPLLSFTKNWENPDDYPTVETDEMKVRQDMQSLHDEVKNFLNEELIPRVVLEDATVGAWTASEDARVANEAERVANEEKRATNEAARVAAESARTVAEQARALAEQARVDSTTGVVSQATEQAKAASASAVAASGSASAAGTSATEAAQQASTAFTWASNAEQAASHAVEAANGAGDSCIRAEESAGQAAASATSAARSEAEAKRYAELASSAGRGDMLQSVYDPAGKRQDVFKYVDTKVSNIPTPDVSGQINAHNESTSAHSDIRQLIANKKGAQVYEATIGTAWAENEDTGVKTQTVTIAGITAENTAKVDHSSASVDGTSDGYATFVEEENQYLTYITNGFAETVAGGIKFTIFGDAPTVSIPIVVEVV